MQIVEWVFGLVKEFGFIALQWYVLYVLVAGCAFGAWLWYTVWHHEHHIKAHDVSHHRAD